MIKISVFIVSYNQEKYIAQAIESVVQQSVKPYEIIISDDCSKDNTWNIIKHYQSQYPTLIKAFRNDPNLGIFRNFNETTRRTTGNLITCVAGDDFIMPGYFEHISRHIEENQLDPDKDSFIIIPNIVSLYENGLKTKYSNVFCQNKNLIACRLRGLIDDRYGVVSRISLDKTDGFIENIGLHGDFVWCFERFVKTDKIFFINGYYSVYRQGVGIVSKTKEVDASKSLLEAINILLQKLSGQFDRKDLMFIAYIRAKSMYTIRKSLKNYFTLIYCTLLNTGNYGTTKKQMKAWAFLLLPNKLKIILFKIKRLEALSRL